jgi:pimeloyl-ACP methyl ester carboxylesterase
MRLKKTASRIGWVLLAGAAIAATIGALRTHAADAAIRASNPPPGAFVDVGGYRLHYRLEGSGELTFVLEAGLGDYSAVWRKVEAPLATMGRVFLYDRAGYGWSDPGPEPRTMQQVVRELALALKNARVPGPYLLVGHSFGGATQTLFAETHPENVIGLLLIEPSEKEAFVKLPQPPFLQRLMIEELPRTAPVGLAQLLLHPSDPVERQAKHIETFGEEFRAIPASLGQWGDAPIDLHGTPIYVLTGAESSGAPARTPAEKQRLWRIWYSLHQTLVDASTSPIRKHIVVEGASHYIHLQKPDAVVAAAQELVSRIRQAREGGGH